MKNYITGRSKPFYGWFVVFLAFLALNTYGVFYSYSAFITPLEAELQTNRAGISGAYTTFLAVYSLFAIPMGWLADRYGPRRMLWLAALLIGGGFVLCSTITSLWQLYLLFGVMAGIGHGAIFVVPTSTVSRWFAQRRGLALGMAVCGVGVGLLVLPPIAARLIEAYSWQTTFIFLGVVAFIINVVVGALIKGKPEDKGLKPYGAEALRLSNSLASVPPYRDYSLGEVLRTKSFWLIYFVCVFAFSSEQMVLVHIIPYSSIIGITPTTASLGLSFLGIGTIIGRVGTGALSDRIGRVPTLILSCCLEAVAIFALLVINSSLTLFATMLVIGFGYGGWAVLASIMFGDYYGMKNLGVIIGVYFSSGIPAGILGPLLGGIIYDATKNYFMAFLIAGIVCLVAIVLATLVKTPPRIAALEAERKR